jgi:hypothetical protein
LVLGGIGIGRYWYWVVLVLGGIGIGRYWYWYWYWSVLVLVVLVLLHPYFRGTPEYLPFA